PSGVPTADAVMARAGGENFPVASRLLPRAVRGHLLAVYGFARLADQLGDDAPGDRLAHLDWLEAELDRAYRGEATHPVLARLAPTLDALSLPPAPFRDLVEANRLDQVAHRYSTFDDLLAYCRLSANPVGRLVLAVFGLTSPDREALSDQVCTGLQIVEHLQDVGEDRARGRVYLPADDLARFGCDESDLGASRAGPALRGVVAFQAARARTFLDAGGPLSASLPGRARVAVAGFAAGGLAALDAVERADFDVLGTRCRPTPAGAGRHLVMLLVRGR
ncbi:MAG: squalene synthase HpnC, partial [Acidimicrobiales bacterium]